MLVSCCLCSRWLEELEVTLLHVSTDTQDVTFSGKILEIFILRKPKNPNAFTANFTDGRWVNLSSLKLSVYRYWKVVYFPCRKLRFTCGNDTYGAVKVTVTLYQGCPLIVPPNRPDNAWDILYKTLERSSRPFDQHVLLLVVSLSQLAGCCSYRFPSLITQAWLHFQRNLMVKCFLVLTKPIKNIAE